MGSKLPFLQHANIDPVRKIELSADSLIQGLLGTALRSPVSILDSCGVGYLDSHLLIAGIHPTKSEQIFDLKEAIACVENIALSNKPAIFTLSYEFGRFLQDIQSRHKVSNEPLVYIAEFDNLLVHDYGSGTSLILGEGSNVSNIEHELKWAKFEANETSNAGQITTDFSKIEYLFAIEHLKEQIRSGNTYQTNLTRRINSAVPLGLTPESIFWRLRKSHPAPFSAFIRRPDSTVISASPERFFKLEKGSISAAPIKGTRPRGSTAASDSRLREELVNSEKDRAENTMIVDLLRNDLGRICDFGSVKVDELCRIEEHPSLFHLVSTISGKVREGVRFPEILAALFPCGSITGAPKLSTMRIIDKIEKSPRGLSMGAIGYRIPASFGLGEVLDLSVAIRTMVIQDGIARFNVGGGIVIDSDPEDEWDETVVKSTALLNALGIQI
jgi:aminodeoxychorismate synthase component I